MTDANTDSSPSTYEAWHVAAPVFCTYHDLDAALEAVAKHANKGQHKVTGDVLESTVLFRDGKVQRIAVKHLIANIDGDHSSFERFYAIDRITVVGS
jgi:hypothetical protein